MLYQICFIFLIFFSYSIFGWLVECIFCTIVDKKLTYDRGFLLGPYCPIYGWGTLYMYFFLTKYREDPFTLFVMAVVGTTILEYFTSYMMEKLFKARWWDYSNQKFNIEGRVCLLNSFLFGVLGLAFIYVIHPCYSLFLERIPDHILIILSTIFFIIYLVDNIFSFVILGKLKIQVGKIRKDSTSEIDHQIRLFLSNHNFFMKRLFKAFPHIQILSNRGGQITSAIQSILEKIEKESEKYKKKIEKERRKSKKRIAKIKLKIETAKSYRKKEKLKAKLKKEKSKV